ncbi:MAG: RDD family protein, partial [Armatimonadetes bacterium]|nr:RDD family protein [Armatimonadota bacterium]
AAAAGTFVFLGYFIIFEMLWNGQSPGKRAARIRVIRDDGTPITFVESAIRNLLRIVDFLPFYYGVGLLSILLSRRNKRLGDFAAGTVVVKIPAGDELEPLPEVPSDGHYVEKTKILAPYVSQLTQPEINAIQHFMERRAELEPRTRRRLAMQIADSVRQKLADHAHAALPSDPEQMLAVLYAAIVEHQRRI